MSGLKLEGVPAIKPRIRLTKSLVEQLELIGGEIVLFERHRKELHMVVVPKKR